MALRALVALGAQVVEDRCFALGHCRFSIWRGSGHPVNKVGVCADDDQAFAVLDIEAFERVLKLARPSLIDFCSDTELLQSVLPDIYSLLPAKQSNYINKKTGHRPRPEMQNGSLVFFCNAWHTGRVAKITCSELYEVAIEDAGEGFQMDFL